MVSNLSSIRSDLSESEIILEQNIRISPDSQNPNFIEKVVRDLDKKKSHR